MLLEGIFPAITTPFYPDGRLYLRKIEHNVDRFSRTPVAGMVVLGSTGESVMLSDSEQREVLKIAREFASPEKVLIAGTGCESAEGTLALTEYAASLGYDVALVRTPSFYHPQMQTANLVAYYHYVADRSPLPVLLYNVPCYTAYDLPAEAVVELAGHRNIIGIKDSGGGVDKVAQIVSGTKSVRRTVNVTEIFRAVTGRMQQGNTAAHGEVLPVEVLSANKAAQGSGTAIVAAPPAEKPRFKMRQKEIGFQVLTGSTKNLKASLEAGATGAVLGFAAAAPTACYEVYTAHREGDEPLAAEKQRRIAEPSARIADALGTPGIKYAMDLNGYYGGPCRLPLLPITGAVRKEIESLMSDIRH